MKPKIVWRLRDEEVFERAIALHFSSAPASKKKEQTMERIRNMVITGLQRSASHKLKTSANKERVIKCKSQRANEPEQEWLEIRCHILDDGETVEIVGVEYPET